MACNLPGATEVMRGLTYEEAIRSGWVRKPEPRRADAPLKTGPPY